MPLQIQSSMERSIELPMVPSPTGQLPKANPARGDRGYPDETPPNPHPCQRYYFGHPHGLRAHCVPPIFSSGRSAPAQLQLQLQPPTQPKTEALKQSLKQALVKAQNSSTCDCKSDCLKLYCECFALLTTCGAECRCLACRNTSSHISQIKAMRNMILEHDPGAFENKLKGIFKLKGPFTAKEDRKLVELVKKLGKKWTLIAMNLLGRSGKQCSERWRNVLNPEISKEPWTEEEDRTTLESHIAIGNRWAKIAKKLPGRSDAAIRNRWHSSADLKGNIEKYLASRQGVDERSIWYTEDGRFDVMGDLEGVLKAVREMSTSRFVGTSILEKSVTDEFPTNAKEFDKEAHVTEQTDTNTKDTMLRPPAPNALCMPPRQDYITEARELEYLSSLQEDIARELEHLCSLHEDIASSTMEANPSVVVAPPVFSMSPIPSDTDDEAPHNLMSMKKKKKQQKFLDQRLSVMPQSKPPAETKPTTQAQSQPLHQDRLSIMPMVFRNTGPDEPPIKPNHVDIMTEPLRGSKTVRADARTESLSGRNTTPDESLSPLLPRRFSAVGSEERVSVLEENNLPLSSRPKTHLRKRKAQELICAVDLRRQQLPGLELPEVEEQINRGRLHHRSKSLLSLRMEYSPHRRLESRNPSPFLMPVKFHSKNLSKGSEVIDLCDNSDEAQDTSNEESSGEAAFVLDATEALIDNDKENNLNGSSLLQAQALQCKHGTFPLPSDWNSCQGHTLKVDAAQHQRARKDPWREQRAQRQRAAQRHILLQGKTLQQQQNALSPHSNYHRYREKHAHVHSPVSDSPLWPPTFTAYAQSSLRASTRGAQSQSTSPLTNTKC